MKKILISSILSLILIASFFNIGAERVSAQLDIETADVPPQCCKIRHSITVGGTKISAGSVLGPKLNLPPGFCEYTVDVATPYWAGICLIDGIQTISDWIFWIAFIVTGIAILFAGITFVTAAGDPERVAKAKKIFFYSLIGVLVIVLAEFIPGIVRYFIGV